MKITKFEICFVIIFVLLGIIIDTLTLKSFNAKYALHETLYGVVFLIVVNTFRFIRTKK